MSCAMTDGGMMPLLRPAATRAAPPARRAQSGPSPPTGLAGAAVSDEAAAPILLDRFHVHGPARAQPPRAMRSRGLRGGSPPARDPGVTSDATKTFTRPWPLGGSTLTHCLTHYKTLISKTVPWFGTVKRSRGGYPISQPRSDSRSRSGCSRMICAASLSRSAGPDSGPSLAPTPGPRPPGSSPLWVSWAWLASRSR